MSQKEPSNNLPILHIKHKTTKSSCKINVPVFKLFKNSSIRNSETNNLTIKFSQRNEDKLENNNINLLSNFSEYSKNVKKAFMSKAKNEEEKNFPFSQDEKLGQAKSQVNNRLLMNLSTPKEKVHKKDEALLSSIISSAKFLFSNSHRTMIPVIDEKSNKDPVKEKLINKKSKINENKNEASKIKSKHLTISKTLLLKTIESERDNSMDIIKEKISKINENRNNSQNKLNKQQTFSKKIKRILLSPKREEKIHLSISPIPHTNTTNINANKVIPEINQQDEENKEHSKPKLKLDINQIKEQLNISPIKKTNKKIKFTIDSNKKTINNDNNDIINKIRVDCPEEQHFVNVLFILHNKELQKQF